jgi:phosphotriesterase-related protein
MGTVVSVEGTVSADSIGITLPHEHLVADVGLALDGDDRVLPADRSQLSVTARRRLKEPVTLSNLWWLRGFPQPQGLSLDNYRLDDPDVVTSEVARFTDMGGGTIVDVSNFGLGRDPEALRRIANRTDVTVVAGTGHYIRSAHPVDMNERSVDEIAARMRRDIEHGIDNTAVRAGVIGEIGTSAGYESHPNERKSVRAAAAAQQETGALVTLHAPFFDKEAHTILDDLEDAGADLSNVAVGHLDGTIRDDDGFDYHGSLADRNVYLEFDCFGKSGYRPSFDRSWPLDEDRVEHIRRLFDAGYADQILVSQDVFKKSELTAYGGHGYANVLRSVVPLLRARDFSVTDIDRLLVDNPAVALSLD